MMTCLTPVGKESIIYDSNAFICYVYKITEPDGWVLQITVRSRLTIKDIAIGGQLMRDFLANASDESSFSIFDLRCCELFTIQQAQSLAEELRALREEITSKVICSAICVSDNSTINGVIKRFLKGFYTPVRPLLLCENGLSSDKIRRRFSEESLKIRKSK